MRTTLDSDGTTITLMTASERVKVLRAEIAQRDAEIERLRAEVQEQARLLGMGISIEREAKLRARVEVLERVLEAALSDLFTPSKETSIALLKAVREAQP
jgi:predicted RNase H-like nuclease (RuvC/YqgF family)